MCNSEPSHYTSTEKVVAMEPSCAPDLPVPYQKDAEISKLPYVEKLSTVIEFSYKWEIPNFHHATIPKIVKSPVFSPGVYNQLKWSLIMYPLGGGRGGRNGYISGNEHLSLYLCLEHYNKPEITATFQMSILSREVKKRTIQMNKPWTFKHGTSTATCGYSDFVTRREITDNNYLLNYTFTILCEIQIYASIDSFSKTNEGIPLEIPNSQLLKNIESLFTNKKYTDFTIVVDGQKFPVHKSILTVRSSVFAAMFEHDTEEQKNHRVDIKDMSPEVLQEMLCFIYTDKVTNIKKVAFDLLAAANKYDLQKLTMMCAEALRKSISIQNVVDILILADIHNAYRLKDEAITFISAHTIATMDTKGFQSMIISHPHLVAEILHAMAMKKDGKKVCL